jgi:hypothetical protein
MIQSSDDEFVEDFLFDSRGTLLSEVTKTLHAAEEADPGDVYLRRAVFTNGAAFKPLCGCLITEGGYHAGEPAHDEYEGRCDTCLRLVAIRAEAAYS